MDEKISRNGVLGNFTNIRYSPTKTRKSYKLSFGTKFYVYRFRDKILANSSDIREKMTNSHKSGSF